MKKESILKKKVPAILLTSINPVFNFLSKNDSLSNLIFLMGRIVFILSSKSSFEETFNSNKVKKYFHH